MILTANTESSWVPRFVPNPFNLFRMLSLTFATIQHLIAPFEYVKSLPSKGIREALVDAVNAWLVLPERTIKVIKTVAQKLHSSSLL